MSGDKLVPFVGKQPGNKGKATLIVAIPTTGRPDVVAPTVRKLARQNRLPDRVIICSAEHSDVPPNGFGDLPFPVVGLTAPKGACAQRNRILREVKSDDIVMFMDDDFLLASDYLQRVEVIFRQNPTFALVTGRVLADGIKGPGITHSAGDALLEEFVDAAPHSMLEPVYNGYGCNMAVRVKMISQLGVRFDEKLPRYGWLEDLDFSRRLSKAGQIIRANELQGVHLGFKGGRTPGKMLGYSQMVNPIYLARNGSMAPWRAARIMSRNLASNLFLTFRSEPWVDRRGRLNGNIRAIGDLILGRSDPRRLLDF